MSTKRPSQRIASGQLRIIGGEWRGRRLPVIDQSGLRPTPDRVRETLFNWLAPMIEGARCLDAFAGTGALGLEALSRGAGQMVFVEQSRKLAAAIESNLQKLGENAQVVCTSFAQFPLSPAGFDIVFLDPPFNAGLLEPAAARLTAGLAPGNRVYMEYAREQTPALGPGWEILKQKHAGQVGFCLATWNVEVEDKPL